MNDFEKALKTLPQSVGFDALAHKTVEDLCWICLHELDLVAEREYWLPLAERKRLLNFIEKHGHYVDDGRRVYQQSLGVTRGDCYTND